MFCKGDGQTPEKEVEVDRVDEKRAEKRYSIKAPLILKLFPSFDPHPAQNVNQSNNGISFESGVGFKPGTIVFIRREGCPENCPAGKACESCRTIGLATIIWCKKNGAAEPFLFSAGAKYFEYGIGY